jgi:hypothetical protein
MKIIHFHYFLFFSTFLGISCASTRIVDNALVVDNVSNAENEINAVVVQASDYLVERLPENTPVSLMNISENDLDVVNTVLTRISSELVNSNKLMVVARDNLQPIRIEQGFQLENASEESLVSIGNFLGAKAVITCSVVKQNGSSRLYVKALDTESGQIKADKSYDLAFLSSDDFSLNISNTLPLPKIEKTKAEMPDFIKEFPPAEDELWGVGTAGIIESYENAMDRANISIARQIILLFENERTDRAAASGREFAALNWEETRLILPEILLPVSRNAIVVKRSQTGDGTMWYLTALKRERVDQFIMEIEKRIELLRNQ